jgi:GT2 family glycosyltransferase
MSAERRAGAPADPADADALRAELAEARAELDPLLAQLGERERELREAAEERERAAQAVAADRARLRSIEQSVSWRVFERVRGRFYGSVGGRGSLPARIVQSSLRTAGRRLPPTAATGPPPAPSLHPIRFPRVERPRVSIVIPVHARPDLTENCLRSIAEHTDGPSYEVIVVDDRAPDHELVWAALENAYVIHNDANEGYLRSNTLAAERARGQFLLLLNNDTEVRAGWLASLVARADGDRRIGVVVPKLLFMDGTLQEAGGIVFDDGSGWNYGRGRDTDDPEFNYMREVDYGSAACLLVRSRVWRELGGFDERYLPMYYEDTDLCFAAREAGYSVVFEPRAAVFHVEGATAGTDLNSGGKRFQEINRAKFAEKWAARLTADQLRASPQAVRRASDRNRGPHVLVIDHRVPSPDRDSGSVRMWELLKALLELGCRVTFLPDNHLRWEPYSDRLQSMGVEVLYSPFSVPAEIAAIGAQMRLAIVSRPQVATRYLHFIREYCPEAKVVFDTVDLHYVREQRRAELTGGAIATAADTWREIELALVRVTDVTAVVSEPEREEVLRQEPGADVVVLPNANVLAASVPPPEERSGLLFVGSFEHLPNVDAAVWLVNSIMPLVWRELGDVTVTIVGADPLPEVLALAGPGVEVAGWVEDLQPLLDSSRVMVAPLRYGAGMKGKVTQSLANGLPVVTTAIGAEGLGAEDGREMLIADDPDEFTERVARAYRDDELWSELSAAGQRLVERTCSPATLRERLRLLLADAG